MGSLSLFLNMGDGATSLIVAILRNLVFVALFAITVDMGKTGVWWRIVAGEMPGNLPVFTWSAVCISCPLK